MGPALLQRPGCWLRRGAQPCCAAAAAAAGCAARSSSRQPSCGLRSWHGAASPRSCSSFLLGPGRLSAPPLGAPLARATNARRCLASRPAIVACVAEAGMVAGVMWAALRHSARVIAATNALGFAVTAVTQSHKITDLCGTASFALSAWATHSAAARALGQPALAPTRGALLAGCVSVWALRLGGYLFYRVLKVGKDARLDQFFQQPGEPLLSGPSNYPLRLAFFWTMQGLWSWIGLLPITAAHALSRSSPAAFKGLGGGPWLAAGAALFAGGLLLESVADWQKFVWKSDPDNAGRFMGPVGLFAWSRHPNYFGEMCVWAGLFLMAGPAVWRAAPWAAASPAFTFFLLRFLSGVPPLERSYAERYGGQPAYEQYKAATNLLLPWPPRDKWP